MWRTYRAARRRKDLLAASPAEDALCRQYQPLCRRIAGRLAAKMPEHTDRADMIADGMMGLLHAVRGYRPRKGAFLTYARTCIRGLICSGLHCRLPYFGREPASRRGLRLPLSGGNGNGSGGLARGEVALDSLPGSCPPVDHRMETAETADVALRAMKPKDRAAFSLLAAGWTRAEIGRAMQISRERVGQIIARGRGDALRAIQAGQRAAGGLSGRSDDD